ncbi:MAG: lysophospholipid acyltransferase family protein [Candidatus Omnitrophica bacterium]|nr:lysophospholipid acyltransferase family protein [Candidatus Omnitrophota bacterium]MDD5655466.1 lysophospholipid acyltransferase family protein [Candidatus Omnitrophota bacterium]
MFYWVSRLFFILLFKLFFRLKVEGLENLPAKRNFLLVSNHASFLDPFAISAAIPRYIRWIVVDEYFDLLLVKWILKQLRFIRTRGKTDSRALHQAVIALKNNDIVGIFPEGRRTEDGRLGKVRGGMAHLARESCVLVLPVGILGSFEAWPRTRSSIRLYPITVRIGKPIDLSGLTQANASKEILLDASNKIMSAVQELLN